MIPAIPVFATSENEVVIAHQIGMNMYIAPRIVKP